MWTRLVDDVLAFTSGEIEKIPGFYGAKSTCAAATITGNIPMGADVGALPDGRLAGEPIAEGGISPHQGRNTSGITATMASVAKLDPMNFRHGSVLNIRIDPDAVKDRSKLEKLAMLVRSFHAWAAIWCSSISSAPTPCARHRNIPSSIRTCWYGSPPIPPTSWS